MPTIIIVAHAKACYYSGFCEGRYYYYGAYEGLLLYKWDVWWKVAEHISINIII